MAKHQRKVQEALRARIAAFSPVSVSGQKQHKPGSQNRKRTGYGNRSARR